MVTSRVRRHLVDLATPTQSNQFFCFLKEYVDFIAPDYEGCLRSFRKLSVQQKLTADLKDEEDIYRRQTFVDLLPSP